MVPMLFEDVGDRGTLDMFSLGVSKEATAVRPGRSAHMLVAQALAGCPEGSPRPGASLLPVRILGALARLVW
jgi:hypothetical protein